MPAALRAALARPLLRPPRARRGRRARARAAARRRAARPARRRSSADAHSVLLVPRLLGGAAAGRRAPRLARPARRGRDRRRARGRARGRQRARVHRLVDRAAARGRRGRRGGRRRERPAVPEPARRRARQLRGRRRGSRIPPTTSPTGTSTSARSRTRGSCASPASAPTARGGCPSTPRARSCSTTRRSPRRAARAREALLDAGWVVEARGLPAARASCPAGWSGTTRLRRLHAQALEAGEDFGDIYSPAGARAFARWLTTPGERGRGGGHRALRARPVAASAATCARPIRDLDGDRRRGATSRWLWVHGRAEMGLAERRCCRRRPRARRRDERVPPVLVTGYLRGNLGLGEAARGYTRGAAGGRRAGRDARRSCPSCRSSSAAPRPPPRSSARSPRSRCPDGAEPEVNLLCVNAAQVARARRASSARRRCARATRSASGRGRPTRSRRAWDRSFDLVDELWVYSRYVAENLARATDVDVPVVVVPLPVDDARPGGATRAVRAAGRLRLPVRLRLLLDARAQEPARAGRGVQARVRARRGADAAAQDDQRATSGPRRASACATRSATAPDIRARRRAARARRDGRAVRARRLPTSRCTAPRASG